jgi:hypothetical protein
VLLSGMYFTHDTLSWLLRHIARGSKVQSSRQEDTSCMEKYDPDLTQSTLKASSESARNTSGSFH